MTVIYFQNVSKREIWFEAVEVVGCEIGAYPEVVPRLQGAVFADVIRYFPDLFIREVRMVHQFLEGRLVYIDFSHVRMLCGAKPLFYPFGQVGYF